MFIEACIIACGMFAGSELFKKIKGNKQGKAEDPQHAPIIEKAQSPVQDQGTLPDEEARTEYELMVNRNVKYSYGIASLAIAGNLFFSPLKLVSGICLLYAGRPLFKRAKDAVFKEKRVRIEILDTFAVLAAFFLGYFTTGAIMSILYWNAQKLRLKTENRSRKSLTSIFKEQPLFVWRYQDGVEVEIPFHSLQAGNIIVVHAGEPVPADGVITYGYASIDQHLLTGESRPAEKGVGDEVFASTVIISGRIHVKVEKAGDETVAAKICEILNNTADFTAAVESAGQEIADASVVPSLLLSIVGYPLVGVEGTAALFSSNFLSSFRMTSPIGMLNFLNIASKNSILIKDGRSLQLLPVVDTVVFDKTGTLTQEQPFVRKIHTFHDTSEDQVLTLGAAAEYRQIHPIAAAIIEEAGRRNLIIPAIDETNYRIGFGVAVRVEHQWIRVGSEQFMVNEGIEFPEGIDEIRNESFDQGCSLIYVASGSLVIGAIELHPTIRSETRRVIKRLKEMDMSLIIISGDHEKPTKLMAETLAFDGYFAEVLPKDKADLIEQLQKEGRKVCFVGDGINDAIALKKANVSVSMRGASTVATDSAQVVLMDETLEKLPSLFELAVNFQNTMRDTFCAVSAPVIFCIGGVFYANFTLFSTVVLYGASLASGAAVAVLPALKKNKRLIGSEVQKT